MFFWCVLIGYVNFSWSLVANYIQAYLLTSFLTKRNNFIFWSRIFTSLIYMYILKRSLKKIGHFIGMEDHGVEDHDRGLVDSD